MAADTAPPYVIDGQAHFWSGAAPWRDEIYGGDEPWDPDYDLGTATPGPGAYDTPACMQMGPSRLPSYARGPSSAFASNVRRDLPLPGRTRTKQRASAYSTYSHQRTAGGGSAHGRGGPPAAAWRAQMPINGAHSSDGRKFDIRMRDSHTAPPAHGGVKEAW